MTTAYNLPTAEVARRLAERRFCGDCAADVLGNDPHEPGCPAEANRAA